MPTIAALVPMRHNSQRVPGKNYRPLAGKPLYQHIIETLLAVPEITSIMVDTDSEPVMDGLRAAFPRVKIIQRPENLRAPEIPMNEILAYDTAQVEADFYLQTRLWDPLTRPINHNPAILLQTQDLPPVYEENSCFYLFTRQNLLTRRNRMGERPLMFDIPRLEAIDIDEEADFEIADLLMRRRLGIA